MYGKTTQKQHTFQGRKERCLEAALGVWDPHVYWWAQRTKGPESPTWGTWTWLSHCGGSWASLCHGGARPHPRVREALWPKYRTLASAFLFYLIHLHYLFLKAFGSYPWDCFKKIFHCPYSNTLYSCYGLESELNSRNSFRKIWYPKIWVYKICKYRQGYEHFKMWWTCKSNHLWILVRSQFIGI